MRAINILLIILSTAFAINTLADGTKAETTAMQTFLKCISIENQDLEKMGKCTKPFLSKELTQSQKKRLLGWFFIHPKLTVVDCDAKSLERAQRKYSDQKVSYICANDGGASATATPDSGYVLVFKADSPSEPRLINLIEKR